MANRFLLALALAFAAAPSLRAALPDVHWGGDITSVKPEVALLKAVEAMGVKHNFVLAEVRGKTLAFGGSEKATVVVTVYADGDGSHVYLLAAGEGAEGLRNSIRSHIFDGKFNPKTPSAIHARDSNRKMGGPTVLVKQVRLDRPHADFGRITKLSMARQGLNVESFDDGSTLCGSNNDGMAVAWYDDVRGGKNHVLRVFGIAYEKTLAEHLRNAVASDIVHGVQPSAFGYRRMATGPENKPSSRPLLVVALQDPDRKPLGHDIKHYDQLVFGPKGVQDKFVNRYYTEVSGGQFHWDRVGVLGPYNVAGLAKLNEDEFRQQAIRQAAQRGKLDFRPLDKNKDGVVDSGELVVAIISNLAPEEDGAQRSIPRMLVAGKGSVAVDTINVQFGGRAGFSTWCHELLHTLGAIDMYGPWGDPLPLNLNEGLTLMGATLGDPDDMSILYPDPWHRIQLGWDLPRVHDLRRDGSVVLAPPQLPGSATKTNRRPLVLYDSWRGPDEYFLIEFRNPSPMPRGDANVAGSGIAIWQVKQDPKGNLVQVPADANKKLKTDAVFARGAPDWRQGGNQLWNKSHGAVKLRWIDQSDVHCQLQIGAVSKEGDSVTVSWKAK